MAAAWVPGGGGSSATACGARAAASASSTAGPGTAGRAPPPGVVHGSSPPYLAPGLLQFPGQQRGSQRWTAASSDYSADTDVTVLPPQPALATQDERGESTTPQGRHGLADVIPLGSGLENRYGVPSNPVRRNPQPLAAERIERILQSMRYQELEEEGAFFWVHPWPPVRRDDDVPDA